MDCENAVKKYNVYIVKLDRFNDRIEKHLEKNSVYSRRMMNQNDIINLVEPVTSLLFFIKNNIEVIDTSSPFREVFYYFSLEEFIELFDELQIEFSTFLERYGVSGVKKYDVIRENTNVAFFKEK